MAGRKDLFIDFLPHLKNIDWSGNVQYLLDATWSGSVEFFEYLIKPANQFNFILDTFLVYEDSPDYQHTTALNVAAGLGHLKLVQFILSKKIPPTEFTLEFAVT